MRPLSLFNHAAFILAALCLSLQAHAGFDEGMAAYDKCDFKGAYEEWRPLAESGNARAQGWLGRLHDQGLGVEKDVAAGLEWYRKSVAQNDAFGQAGLGGMYLGGRSVLPRDPSAGIQWIRKAAERGVVLAQYNLGLRFHLGMELPKDAKQANRFLTKAAKGFAREARQGHLDGKTLVASFFVYRLPGKVDVDAKQALTWLTEAAECGYAFAQTMLANDYVLGVLSREDKARAFHWYEKAAANGEAEAEYQLSEFHGRGWVVTRNDSAAVEWLKKAAEQDHSLAQHSLGMRYRKGDGVPQDDMLALHWLEKAAAKGFKPAQEQVGIIKRTSNQ